MGEWEYSLFDFGGLHMTITAKIIRKGNTGYRKVYFSVKKLTEICNIKKKSEKFIIK
jgi:hypothetical protein